MPPIARITVEARRKVFSFIHFLAVLLALVIACGGSGPTATPTPKPAVGGQAALDTLKRSTEAMEAVKSFRAPGEGEE